MICLGERGDYSNFPTGIGYAVHDNSHPELSNIRVLLKWGLKMGNDVKIPSVISYSPCTDENEQQFGASLSPDAVAMINTKLELDAQDTRLDELDLIIQVLEGTENLNFEHVKRAQGYPDYTWKAPEDIVTDYLTKGFEHFERGTDYLTEIKNTVPVDIIITVPVVCLTFFLLIELQAHLTIAMVLQSKELHTPSHKKCRIQRRHLSQPGEILSHDGARSCCPVYSTIFERAGSGTT